MKLSIIVPVYNMADGGKLEFCLDSLLNQTILDYEIITVNDASTDGSLDILRSYEARYPQKIKVITYPVNRRQGGAKNEGLKAASGEWIGFIDSDDWITPDFYEKLLKRAGETGTDRNRQGYLNFTHFENVDEPVYFYFQHDTSTVHYIAEEKCRS